VLGTASYLSPEQAQGERTTAASDLYSLGIVAFELLTGRRPFVGDSVAAEAVAHVTGEVPSVRELNPALPIELDAVFARALAKDPAERFASGAEFVAALRQSLEDAAGATGIVAPVTVPLAAAAPTRAYARQRTRRSRLTPVIVLLVLLGIGGAIAGVLLAGGNGKPAATPPTTAAPPTTAPTTTPPPVTTTPPTSDPTALNNQAYVYMTQHNFAAALPLLQQAVQELQGQSSITAGYANYNLGVTLIALGRCADAVPYLQTARQIEPGRHEVHDALKAAQHCGGGGGGDGNGNGNGNGGD
jgi:serine/threonine-protein kinase